MDKVLMIERSGAGGSQITFEDGTKVSSLVTFEALKEIIRSRSERENKTERYLEQLALYQTQPTP